MADNKETQVQQEKQEVPAKQPRAPREPKQKKEPKEAPKENKQAPKQGQGSGKSALLGITNDKNVNFSEWYSEVIIKAEMIEYYDISGCYILRPWSYGIWEQVQEFFNKQIKRIGVQNAYFPLFVSEKALSSEKDHIEGFAAEVAWVTRSGKSPLTAPIAVRPTSETIMYPAYAKWIRSHRDLPLRLNQWCNVVRWEFKHPTPFLRSREFLWQEGHTAFSNLKDAGDEVLQILELYRRVYEELLAVPVVKGKKTENEKFPGGLYTTTVEAFIPASGRGVQAATSHCLGQNFAKMFNIQFENDNKQKEYAWQNSWGLTTRSLGIMIMLHGDEKGLVLPPRVAPYQVVIVPIFKSGKDSEVLLAKARDIVNKLADADVRAHIDDSTTHNPGFKFNHWEMRGVPLRFEFGFLDVESNSVVAVRREKPGKETIPLDNVVARTKEILDDIHNSLFANACRVRDERIAKITTWEEFVPALDARKVALAPWCDNPKCEDLVKDRTKEKKKAEEKKPEELKPEEFEPLTGAAKSLCIPFDQPALEEGQKCFQCGEAAKHWVLWGRSF
eukprot:TRINITY_DN1565_c0_g1_i1.p1 TRINITY_DN1565_c0_g1~~TRINITY_DN1565_c0_g1_i1.p1  ORF type:complete len:582 (+),score=158.15 TRINITY_DN1565_c0_g1_i1:70-1746(+)